MRGKADMKKWKNRYSKYLFCIGMGILFFLAAETADRWNLPVENGRLLRNPCGKGDAVYEFYVDGLETEESRVSVRIQVPEQELTKEQFLECLPEMTEKLCTEIAGENPSLQEVCGDLNLVRELPEYGVSVSWKSEQPEVISDMGIVSVPDEVRAEAEMGMVAEKSIEDAGVFVSLKATLSNGFYEETVEIPVTVHLPLKSQKERFEEELETLVLQNREIAEIVLPDKFEGKQITYRSFGRLQNQVLILLGIVAAVFLYLKEKTDKEDAEKRREDSLAADYPDLVSGFLILTGAGYSAKAAWKKMTDNFLKSGKQGFHPLYEEMQVAVNQMETGTPETSAYAAFGRRCAIRCYIRFASLLESSVNTGGKNLRNLLEAEMDDAFRQRAALARRKGEEASSKLLLPMFGMLGVVMVMVVAPAFLTLGG